jgi:hypothetical protein
MDPDHLAMLKRRGWISFGIMVGCLLPFSGLETSLLIRLM